MSKFLHFKYWFQRVLIAVMILEFIGFVIYDIKYTKHINSLQAIQLAIIIATYFLGISIYNIKSHEKRKKGHFTDPRLKK